MAFARAVEQVEAKDSPDDKNRVARTVHAEVRQLIGRKALRMKRPKACFIAEKRSSCHGHAPREKGFNWRIQPDNGNPLRSEKLRSALLCVSAATKCEHDGFFRFCCASNGGAQLIRFEGAESRFAEAIEEF